MKRIYSMMLIVILCLGMMTPIHAEEDVTVQNDPGTSAEPLPDDEKEDVPETPVIEPLPDDEKEDISADQSTESLLHIDNQNIYEGMTTAYRNGYQPVCANGEVTIVLPLVCDGNVKQDTLTASVDLGSTENSPFIYRNYEKNFELTNQPVNGTNETKEIFYITFTISLASNRVNGIYPIVILVTGKDAAGKEINQSFTNFVTITDGIDPNAPADSGGDPVPEPVETPTSAPIVLISNSKLKSNPIQAGKEFEAVITLKNTSTLKAVQNMVATVTVPSSDFELLNESSTIYVGKLGKEKTTELTLRFRVSQGTPEGNYPVQIGMSYDDPKANTYSSAGNFTVTVIQPLDVELTIPKIEKELVAGDTIPLNFQVMNLGRSQIFNVRCDVIGNGLTQTKTAFIGNMESGTAGEAAANIFIDRLEGEDSYGETTGTITLTYEDSLGSEHSQEYTFDTTIIKPVTSESLAQSEEETVSQWWVSILIVGGIGLLAAVGAGAYLLGRKQR